MTMSAIGWVLSGIAGFSILCYFDGEITLRDLLHLPICILLGYGMLMLAVFELIDKYSPRLNLDRVIWSRKK